MKLNNTMAVILRAMILTFLLVALTGNLYAHRAVQHHAKQKQLQVKKTVKHSKNKINVKKCALKKVRKNKKVSVKKVAYRVPRYRHVLDLRAKAFTKSQSSADLAVNNAFAFLGTPYSRGGITSRGMDCSGLVYRVMRDMGRNVPHNAAALSNTGIPISRAQLKKGDLLFFHTTSANIGHVGIYTSDNKFIHASSGAGRVIVTSLSDPYYNSRLRGARRVFNEDGTPVATSVQKTKSSPKAKVSKYKHKKVEKNTRKKVSRKKPLLTKHKPVKK